jgi:hypothetical protein
MSRLALLSRPLAFVLVLTALAVAPSRSRADMPDARGLIDYGFKGFSLGVELGLSMGYIATGPVYRSDEWKKLVLGMGIGAIVGMVGGIVVSVVDATGDGVPMGYFVLRDAGYGTLLGATMGAVIGMLLWVNDGTPKDILKGAAFGTLFGAAAGAVYGVVEGMNAKPPSEGQGWDLGHNLHFGVSPTPLEGGPGVAAHLSGAF